MNYLFTEFQRNSPKKTSKNLIFMLTRSPPSRISNRQDRYSRMRSDAMFSHQSPVKVTAGSHLNKEGYFHISVSTGYFIKEIQNIFSRVPIRYRNTCGSLGELEIAYYQLYGNTENVFYFLKIRYQDRITKITKIA